MDVLEILEKMPDAADSLAEASEFTDKLKAILVLRKQPRASLIQTQYLLQQLDFGLLARFKQEAAKHLPKLSRKLAVVATQSIVVDILARHAQLLKPSLDKWHKQHAQWHRALAKIYTDVELYATELHQLLGKIRQWRQWAETNLFFLPPCLHDHNDYAELILSQFHTYYNAKFESVPKTIAQHLTEAKQLARQVPNARFNEMYPRFSMPAVALPPQVPHCDLCDAPAVLQVFCKTCKDKVVCWNCVRKTIWSAHHDENRVFREPREVNCSFCRAPLDLSHLLQDSVQLVKRLGPESPDDNSPPAKRQMLEQPDPCAAPIDDAAPIDEQ